MTSDALAELMRELEPEYPQLVLAVEPSSLYVMAYVYSADGDMGPRYSVELTTSVARQLMPKAGILQVGGDAVEPASFELTLNALDRGETILDPDLPPTATIHDVVDFILTEAKSNEFVTVKVGNAVWRVEA
jgi:hypothetical protein